MRCLTLFNCECCVQRGEPSYDAPALWTPPELPPFLDGPLSADELSDDSESDLEDEESGAPTWSTALHLFEPSKTADDDDDGGADNGSKKQGTAGKEEEEAEVAEEGVEAAAGQAAEIPRDRARLQLAALEKREAKAAHEWLDSRLRAIDDVVRMPQARFAFDAVPRIHW